MEAREEEASTERQARSKSTDESDDRHVWSLRVARKGTNTVTGTTTTTTTGELTTPGELSSLISSFPLVDHAFGYGSGVFSQTSSSPSGEETKAEKVADELPMLDIILSTSDPAAWHRNNLFLHPDHYATLPRTLGPQFLSSFQRTSAGVYFNPLVASPLSNGRMIKYGVVHTSDLMRDLTEWKWLYLSGRMHKPTVGIVTDAGVEAAQEQNLRFALSASLLLLGGDRPVDDDDGYESEDDEPEDDGVWPQQRDDSSSSNTTAASYDVTALFERIANLSYEGDPRMNLHAEDPNKVHNLVHGPGQSGRFWDLYRDPLTELERLGLISVQYDRKGRSIEYDPWDCDTRKALWNGLPSSLRRVGASFAEEHYMDPNSASMLSNAISAIVAPAARKQSLKGIITAGIGRSARYAAAKLAKGAFRRS